LITPKPYVATVIDGTAGFGALMSRTTNDL
jgi:hypothetical protein